MNHCLKLLLIFIIALNDLSAQKLEESISKQLCEYQKGEGDLIAAKYFLDIRQKLNKKRKLSFININVDTVFVLEEYFLESKICFGSVWNRNDKLEYRYFTYPRRKLDFSIKNVFAERLRKLITDWDIVEIRKYEVENNIVSPNAIYAFRITLGDTIKIDSIRFLEFYIP